MIHYIVLYCVVLYCYIILYFIFILFYSTAGTPRARASGSQPRETRYLWGPGVARCSGSQDVRRRAAILPSAANLPVEVTETHCAPLELAWRWTV